MQNKVKTLHEKIFFHKNFVAPCENHPILIVMFGKIRNF